MGSWRESDWRHPSETALAGKMEHICEYWSIGPLQYEYVAALHCGEFHLNITAEEAFVSQVVAAMQKPSVSVGLGLVYKFEPVRVEVNFGVPLVQNRGEKARRGLQAGIGIEFL